MVGQFAAQGVDIPAADLIHHYLMLAHRAVKGCGILHSQHAQAVVMRVRGSHHVPAQILPGDLKKSLVEPIVQRDKFQRLQPGKTGFLLLDQQLQFPQIQLGAVLQKQRQNGRFQAFPDEPLFLGAGQVNAGDHRALLRRDLHKVLFLQADERLPHRCAADLQLGGQLLRAYRGAGRKLQGGNILFDYAVDILPDGIVLRFGGQAGHNALLTL